MALRSRPFARSGRAGTIALAVAGAFAFPPARAEERAERAAPPARSGDRRPAGTGAQPEPCAVVVARALREASGRFPDVAAPPRGEPPRARAPRQLFFEFEVTRPAERLDARDPAPPGPVAGGGATPSLVHLVVDARGRVEPGTVRILRLAHRSDTATVRAIVARWRFRPARVGRCAVRQLVQAELPLRGSPDVRRPRP